MNFNDAWEAALKSTPPEVIPKNDPNIPKIFAMVWSMVAIALKDKKGLDDTAYISENKQIVSIPLQKSPSMTAETEKNKTVGLEENDDTGKETAKNS